MRQVRSLRSRPARFAFLVGAIFFILAGAPAAAQTVTYSTLVGSTAASSDGTGSGAIFTSASAVSLEAGGDLIVCDSPRVRRITPAAVVTTLPQVVDPAQIANLSGFARDSAGNVYVGQIVAGTIKRIDPAGTITTFYPAAGSPGIGFISALTVDAAGTLYVGDNAGVWKIAPDATATRFAGGTMVSSPTTPPTDGPVGVATFDPVVGIVVDAAGNTYVSTGGGLIRRISPGGVTTTMAGAYGVTGSADGTGSNARFNRPNALAVDAAGNLYISDAGNHTIRRMTPDGTVTTIAGTVGVTGVTQNVDGAALSATFAGPYGLAVAPNGDVFIGDGPAVRKLSGGTVSTFAGSLTLPFGPSAQVMSDMTANRGVAFAGASVYITDAGTHTVRAFNRSDPSSTALALGAGSKGAPGSADGAATATAQFQSLRDIAFDAAGNAYVFDSSTIRRITPAGVATTLAGKPFVIGTTDGAGALARFGADCQIAVAPGGTVYVADGDRIRKVTTSGVVTTLATGFSQLGDVAVDGADNVYATELYAIYRVAPSGDKTVLAGAPGALATPVDGTGSAARFYGAVGIALDAAGDLYVGDQLRLRKVTAAGVVTSVAGSGAPGLADGTGTAAQFTRLTYLAVGPGGTIYGIDTTGLRAITPAGVVTTVTSFDFGRGIGFDNAGTIYVATGQGVGITAGISSVGSTGALTQYLRQTGSVADGDIASQARFTAPAGVAAAADGSLAIADTGNHTIRLLRGNTVSTLAGTAGSSGFVDATGSAARFNAPQGVAYDAAGNVYVADTGNNAVRRITSSGVVSTEVGGLGAPKGVAVDSSGTLYIADSGSHTIKRYSASGGLVTLAGAAGASGSADGAGSAARFSNPAGLTLAPDGTIFVTDTGNHTIRAVTAAGVVTTVGGTAGATGRVNGTGSAARFTGPEALAADPAGSLYIADTQNGSLRLGLVGTATAPAITANPASVAVPLATTVQFTCAATTGNPAAAYEWQRANKAAPTFFSALGNDATYSGVNTPTLTVRSPGASLDGGLYRCRAFNSAGSATSAAATLSLQLFTVTPSKLAFGIDAASGRGTPDQVVTVSWNYAGAPAWTATPSGSGLIPWLTVTNGSGTGSGSFTVGVNQQFSAVLAQTATGTITLASPVDPELTVTIPVRATHLVTDAAPIGVVDTPAANASGLQGSIAVTGWAVDDIEIDHVELWRDPVAGETTPVYGGSGPGNGKIFIANATFVPGARPDIVASIYGDRPGAYNAGWGYMLLTQGLWNQGNGTYTLYAFALDKAGKVSTLGTKTITVDNANATKPFGTIDTPSYGGTVSGMIQNFGWALTPGATCSIANPNVRVSIDSGALTPVVYGDVRSDIAGAFPTYTNAAAAGGHYTLDTTTLTNGMHTIGWFVTDSCGRSDGIGSRFFTVANASSLATTAPAAIAVRAPRDWSLVRGTTAVDPPPAMADGTRVVRVDQAERIELQLPGTAPYAVAQASLPIGSSFDAGAGTFYWQPAAGFLGAYDLAFTAGTRTERVRVVVGPPVRMVIDTPGAGNVLASSGFTIAGWAIDLASLDGAGIDTLHVWAYPVDGGAPQFVGVAATRGARPDVAGLYGSSFAEAGFSVKGTLPAGTYDLIAYAHSAATNSFAGAQTVRVIVR